MDTYSVAPPSNGYDYVNTDPSSPYYMWDYKLGSTAHGEVEHVYGDGRTDWVPAGSPNISASAWAAPAGATPTTIETGNVPGAPIIHAPAPAAPAAPVVTAPSAPAAPAPSTPSAPTTTPIPPAITAAAQEIEKEIDSMSSSQSPGGIITEGKVVTQQIQQLQNQIYAASGSGPGVLDQAQLQYLEGQTVQLGVHNLENEENALQKQGGVSSDDVQALQQQYGILAENVKILEARGAISPNENVQGAMTSLEQQITALSASASSGGSTGTGTPSPIGATGGGTTSGGGSSSSSGGNDPNNGGGSSGTTPPVVVGGTDQPVTSSGSSDPTGGTAAPSSDSAAVSGATYTVVHGDTLSGIAASNNVSLSQLESLNPQIKDPNLIFPGEQVNVGAGGGATDSSAAPSNGGGTYTVVHGDTLSGIAAANGMSTSQIEALNPQIKDPDLIFPGEQVNVGAAGTSASSDSSQTNPPEGPLMRSSSAGVSSNLGSTGSDSNDTSSGGGAIGFPEKSSYPFGTIGAEAEKALGETSANSQAAGWVSGSGNEATDIAKQVFEADNHPNTDPLKINENKNENSGS